MLSKIFKIFRKKIDGKTDDEWLNEGNVLYKQGRYNKALECFNKVLEIDPTCVKAWNGKGLALTKLGRYEEALKCFDKSLSIKDDREIKKLDGRSRRN